MPKDIKFYSNNKCTVVLGRSINNPSKIEKAWYENTNVADALMRKCFVELVTPESCGEITPPKEGECLVKISSGQFRNSNILESVFAAFRDNHITAVKQQTNNPGIVFLQSTEGPFNKWLTSTLDDSCYTTLAGVDGAPDALEM